MTVCNLLQETTAPASFRNQDSRAPQSPSPYSTARILLLRMNSRIERHSDLLDAMGRTLKSLDSGLDCRVASAVKSELGARMAGMEERIMQKILMHSSCKGRDGKMSSESRVSVEPADCHSRGSRSCNDTSGCRDTEAEHGSVAVPPKMRVLKENPSHPATGILKHSFLRRFARTDLEGRLTAQGFAQSEETYASQPPSLMARLLEKVFGICKPDPKEGKEGSKVIHPQSNFHTGRFSRW